MRRIPAPAAAVLAVILTAVSTTVIAGCARKNDGAASDAGRERDRKVRLLVLAGQSSPDPGIEEMINELVGRELPGVELEWESVGWGDRFQSQMQAEFAAGEVPDIMIGKAQDVATYLPSGNIAPVPDSLIRFVREDALASVSSGGVAYGLPYNAFYQGVLYDKDVFDRLNLEPPSTRAGLDAVVRKLKAAGLTPFASAFGENWYAGNLVMQFAMSEVFSRLPDWGDRFRGGRLSFADSAEFQNCMLVLRYIRDSSWPDCLAVENAECEERFATGKAAMYVTGTWTLQTVNAQNPAMRVGIFPYPGSRGDAKLIFEPNMTFMKSSKTSHPAEVDRALAAVFGSRELASEIFGFTRTFSLFKDAGTAVDLPVQEDIDRYARAARVVDVTGGNTQLIWSFQNEVAIRLGEWLRGKASLASVLESADRNRALSGPR